jgi:mxaJ protein
MGSGVKRGRLLVISLIFLLACSVKGQEPSWELRACADPNSLPFSHEEETGFENRIAQLLARELNAELTYHWQVQNPDMVNFGLRAGECDLIMGVPDGYRGLLTTLAYYRSPYAFIYPADSPFDIQSLDDPVLRDLRIGVQSFGIPPHQALLNRGLSGNVVEAYGNRRLTNSSAALFRALVNKEVDVALAWGPVAGYYAARQPIELRVVPVTPELEPPFLSMIIPMTIGLRPGDEALRDRLNTVLVRRWDEIQDVLREYGVPLSSNPKPILSAGEQ